MGKDDFVSVSVTLVSFVLTFSQRSDEMDPGSEGKKSNRVGKGRKDSCVLQKSRLVFSVFESVEG